MNLRTLARRSLAHYAGANWGVIVGAAISTMALVGALLVGSSMRESLLSKSLEGLGPFYTALFSGDRFFRQALAPELQRAVENEMDICSVLLLEAMASAQDGEARANRVQVIGASREFLKLVGAASGIQEGDVFLNEALATQLRAKTGDEILLRLPKPGALSREVTLTDRENSTTTMRLRVGGVMPVEHSGNFSLMRSQFAPMNAFVPISALAKAAGLEGKANAMLGTRSKDPKAGHNSMARNLTYATKSQWELEDASLELRRHEPTRQLELRTSRIFLEPPVIAAVSSNYPYAIPLLTYLANIIQLGTNYTPYSFVTAAGPPYTPADLKDNEIVVSQWLADDLGCKPGDTLQMAWFDPEAGARLIEVTNAFVVRSIVPVEPPWADRTLMPDFPGIEKAETTGDWEVGFELVHKIRPKDETYWKEQRGTPKAFVSLRAGQKLWASRFGELTALRWIPRTSASDATIGKSLMVNDLWPGQLGLSFEPIRGQAEWAASESQDFGGLFIGFSLFVIVSALLLTALLFQFSVEQRASEFGTLLAVGFTPKLVRRLLLKEARGLAMIGGALGVIGGVLYGKAMLWGLGTLWRDAVGVSGLELYVNPFTLFFGWFMGVAVALFAVWLTVRKQSRVPALDLLSGEQRAIESRSGRAAMLIALISIVLALCITGWALSVSGTPNPGAFFGAGVLLLIGGVAAASAWLRRLTQAQTRTEISLGALAVRGNARRRKRAVTTVGLLASGAFVVAAIGVFRLDASRDALAKSSGTGGFQLLGESTLPIVHDLETKTGREFFSLSEQDLQGANVVSMRLRAGDDASCLNLNRAQKPRVLGVRPDDLESRFKFASVGKGLDASRGWDLLRDWRKDLKPGETPEIPAIGDAASIQWALGQSVGGDIYYQTERGTVRLKLIAGVANSILQGNLLIDEAAFQHHFPSESGYRFFLIDAPADRATNISARLTRALQDTGLELTSTVTRLAQFNAVQNTYLGAFQLLGGLGLLLGSAGLGMVVLRNVLERRGELGLLSAVGFSRSKLRRLLLWEHAALLGVGLAVGVAAAALAVLPALLSAERDFSWQSLAWTLLAVLLNGLVWTWLATRWALRGDPLTALRNE